MSDFERRLQDEKNARLEHDRQLAREAYEKTRDFHLKLEEERRCHQKDYDLYVPKVKSMVDSALSALGRQTWSDGFGREFISERDRQVTFTFLCHWSIGRTKEFKRQGKGYIQKWLPTLGDLNGHWDSRELYRISLCMKNGQPYFDSQNIKTENISQGQLENLLLQLYRKGPIRDYKLNSDMRGDGIR